jgi:MFS family permease
MTISSENERINNNQNCNDKKSESAFSEIIKSRDFKLFWLGESVSLIGDQFYFIALPWLVLTLSGDALTLGTILALAAVPRALFMLVGGAVTDRSSPRSVMIGSNIFRLFLVLILMMLVFPRIIQIWMLYIFALSFGLADAFFYPAQMAIVPQLVKKKHLQTANSMVQGVTQLSMFIGPVLAGAVIVVFMSSETDLAGMGIAFGIDAITFMVSVIALSLLSGSKLRQKTAEDDEDSDMLADIKRGISHVWNDMTLRVVFLITLAINFLLVGPAVVGIPVIAEARLPEGAMALGIIMSAFGGGALLGIIFAGALPKPKGNLMGLILLFNVAIMGIALVLFAYFLNTYQLALAALIMGAANGYLMIMIITWIQARTPERMMGRIMSLIMFASVGIAPVSFVVAGVFIHWNEPLMFISMGTALVGITIIAAMTPFIRRMGFEINDEE